MENVTCLSNQLIFHTIITHIITPIIQNLLIPVLKVIYCILTFGLRRKNSEFDILIAKIFFMNINYNIMGINNLRQIVLYYKKFGLPIEKRKLIQKQIGYSKASELVKELDFFIKSDECKSVASPLSIERYNDRLFLNLYVILGRTNSLFRVFSELETQNLQNTLSALKKIKNIRHNKTKNNLFNQDIKLDYNIKKPRLKNI